MRTKILWRRAAWLRLALGVVGASFCLLLMAGTAAAQDAGAAIDDLRFNDVTFEEGALSQTELARLDDLTARLQGASAIFKVVVLSEEVDVYSGAGDFAAAVLRGLSARGRVVVFTPAQVGVASNLDSPSEIEAARTAAERETSGGLTAAVLAAANVLGPPGRGGGGSFSLLPLLIPVLIVPAAMIVFFFIARRRWRRNSDRAEAAMTRSAEVKVRRAIDKAANDILELDDRVVVPDAPPRARELFREGSRAFAQTHDLLEEADTPGELEELYPKAVEAGWKLDSARAVLEGKETPPRPRPEPLFGYSRQDEGYGGADQEELAGWPGQGDVHYRNLSTSPWLTGAAVAALGLLATRGLFSGTVRRSAMPDELFRSMFGGYRGFGGGWTPSWGGMSGRGRTMFGGWGSGSGRGMGRRLGGGFGRGMGGRGTGGRGMGRR